MASILLSRLLPPNTSSPSVYETLREHDQLSDTSDIEERAGMTLDEENLGQAFPGHGLNRALEDAAQSQATTESAMLMHHGPSRQQSHGRSGPHRAASRSKTRPKWMQYSRRQLEADEADDEVPASLLIEGDAHPATGADVNLEGRSLYRLYQARRLEKPGPNGRPHKYSSDSIMMDMIVRLKGHAHQRVILA